MMTLSLPRPTSILLIITGFFVVVSLLWMMSLPPIGTVSSRKSTSVQSASAFHMSTGHSGRENSHPCHPQQKVVFLKTHKTGSTTVASIFQRYGYLNNLTFLVPNRAHFINYRGMFSTDHIHHGTAAKTGQGHWSFDVGYDLLTNHARYDRNELNKVFYNAKYVSILREPTSQFESAFYYFEIWRSLPRSKQPLTLFMENPRKHFELVMGTRQYYKDSMHNQQMFDFGMSHEQMDDEAQVRKKIMELDSELDLVMITEYFDESLLLLRKLLSWQMEDIVYLPKATRSLNYRSTVDQQLRAKILTWNRADDMLYRHFNRSFWLKIREYGPTYSQDLALFRQKLVEVAELCCNKSRVDTNDRRVQLVSLKDGASPWCRHLGRGDVDFTNLIRRKMKSQGVPMYAYQESRRKRG